MPILFASGPLSWSRLDIQESQHALIRPQRAQGGHPSNLIVNSHHSSHPNFMAATRHRFWRCFAAELALLGTLFYATILPWHFTQRHAAYSAIAQLASEILGSICHGAGNAPEGQVNPTHAPPSDECPICKGLAAVELSVVGSLCELPGPTQAGERLAIMHERLERWLVVAPRSRGPPAVI
jgi:hypothetical protein